MREKEDEVKSKMATSTKNDFDILALRTDSLSHNLPDVLPIDVKLQQLSTLAESPVNGIIVFRVLNSVGITNILLTY